LLFTILFSCQPVVKPDHPNPDLGYKIIINGTEQIHGTDTRIVWVEVDDHDYIFIREGGIIHSVSCKNHE